MEKLFKRVIGRITRPDAPPPRHLTQSITLEESPFPDMLRTGVSVIALFISIFLVWAAFTDVKEVATAQGQIIPTGHVQVAQHLEGGIIKEILVKEGDLVEAGQPLIRLDDVSATADLGQMRARQKSLQVQLARLKAFTSATSENLSVSAEEILASMEDSRNSQRSVIKAQIEQKQNELQAAASTYSALQKNIELMRKENDIKQNLAKKGYGSQLMALTSERDLNQLEGQLLEADNRSKAARASVQEAGERLQSVNADLKQQAMKTLGEAQAQLDEVSENIEKLQHIADRTIISAPIRGVIKGLAVNSIGAVIEQGKPLLEVVPMDVEMMAEVMVEPNDVGHLRSGQAVKVKVSAFDSSRYGSVPGNLQSISATTFQTQDGKSFYKALIKLDQGYVGHDPENNRVLPGMTLQAGIITGKKTVLQYLLKPIHSAMENSFHEY